MARAFLRQGDHYVAILDESERLMMQGLMEQTRSILAPEIEPTGDVFADLVASLAHRHDENHGEGRGDDHGEDRDQVAGEDDTADERDPALDRLLPTAHRGDDAVAEEFRRLTEEGLRQRKSANLDVALERVSAAYDDRVELDATQAPAFLMALTDVRLLLGERMGMRTEEDAERLHAVLELIGDDDPLGYVMAWYDFLTWLQETLTLALMGEDV